MAEYRTLTGEFLLSCAKREYDFEGVSSTDATWTSENYIGHTYTDSSKGYDYRLRVNPGSGEAFTYGNTDKIVGVRLKVTFKRKTTTDTSTMIEVRYAKDSDTATLTNGNTWYRCATSTNYYTKFKSFLPDSVTEEYEQTIHNYTAMTTELKNGISKGMSFVYDSSDIIQIQAITLELDVADEYVPPEISFLAENGTMVDGVYHHDPNKAFLVSVDYSQVSGETIQQLNVNGTGFTAVSAWYAGVGETSLSIPSSCWNTLPRIGTLTIVAKGSETESNTLVIPYVVDEYDVHFTSPTSGSVIQSDTDVTISWEAVAPSAQTIDAPSKYLPEIWFDNGEGSGGGYTTLTSKTITADQLTGHSQLHMRLYSYYALCEDSKENAPVMNLYIQQVAGTGNVTVTPDEGGIIMVRWESTGQTAYQVRVGGFFSDIVWGSDTVYKVPFILKRKETYAISVRIQDTQGAWTDWTEPIYYTKAGYTYGKGYTLSASVSKNGVEITVVNKDEIEIAGAIILHRDGEPIANLDVGDIVTYTDTTANGVVLYEAYIPSTSALLNGGMGWLSNTVTVDATPSTDGLVLADETWLPLRYTTDTVKYGGTASEEVYQRYYSGRSYPVVMRSGRKTETLTLSYADPTGDLADTLIEQVGTTVLFKNRDGLKFWGCLESVTPTRHRGWCEVSLTLRKVDVNEWVPLVWGEEE